MNRPIHISARWAPIGLGAVLLALAGFAIWAALSTSAATGRAATAEKVSAAFSDARFAISQQGSLEHRYRLDPSPGVRDAHAEAATELVDAMGVVYEVGARVDRDAAQWTFAREDEYRESVNRLFTAVDEADLLAITRIDAQTAPIFESIEESVALAATRSRLEQQTALDDLRASQRLVLIATPVAFALGLVLLVLFTKILTSALVRSRQQAADNRRMALHDALTGLPNRVLFNDRLGQALRDAARDQTELAVLMIDLDRFKEVNDSLGHAAGDELLVEAATRLQASVRERDTVARMGGDEFAVLLPTTDVAGARRVAALIETAFEESFLLTGLQVEVMASTGIACCPEHGNDAETLLQRADVAMYFAKGRHSGHAMYSDENDPYDPDQLALVGELRRAISDEELLLFFQPKLDLKTNQVTSVEALVRWQHPTRGLLPPVRFVPLAERTGMIRPLTLWVLERALGQCRTWMNAGQELVVGVNLSVQSLLDPEFVAEVTRMLERHGVPARLLEFEITESSVMEDPARSIVLLGRLRELGIGLSIDDFGTGYSSLAYLSQLPVGEIKIDKSFVMAMQTNRDDAVIVRSTIDLARNLGFTVVAEGVETEDALDALRALGCDVAQGYLLSRPVPAQELDAWLASRSITRLA